MTTHPQRRKRRRNRNRLDPASVTAWPPGADLPIDGVGGEVEALDPTDPDVADLITATGVTLDHGDRRIPVTLWRVAAIDHVDGKTWDGLSPRVAGLLVGLTTRPGQTIIDFDADPTLAGVAGAHGVRHIPITRPGQLRRLPAGTASLITLRYPRPGHATRSDRPEQLFAACARLQTRRGSTVSRSSRRPSGRTTPCMRPT